MKKLTFLTAIFLLTTSAAFAQRMGTVTGIITDDATAEKIAGAVIEFRAAADSTFAKHELSNAKGEFTMSQLPYGDYKMRVSILGYETRETDYTVNARNMNMANFFLTQSSTEIEGINVVTQAVRTSMHGDTIVYNAHAFKTSEDADAEELLKQLPGVEVKDGQVTAQGKNISKIFVDGKETFGTDVTSTMKNIPANVIDKVEVYNKLSDFAETTGIHDGDEYQVMNFVTGVSFAQFGEFSGLYGYEDMYDFNGRYNIVTGSHGFIVNASTNNTGASRFGGGIFDGGGMMVGMMGGGGYGGRYGGGGGRSANNKVTNHSAGVNYNYQPSENFTLSFNYRYAYTDNESKSESDTRYFNNPNYDQTFRNSRNYSDNNAHRFGGHIRWKITPQQNISFRLDGSLRNSNNKSWSEQTSFEDGIADFVQYYMQDSKNGSDSYDINAGLNYGFRFGKQGRSLSIGINGSVNKNDGDSFAESETKTLFVTPPIDSLGRRKSANNSHSHSIRGRIQYSEPLSSYWNLMATYETSYRYSDRDNNADIWDFNAATYIPYLEGSNIMETRDYSHRVGPGIYFNKNNSFLRLDFVYKYTMMKGDRTLPEPAYKTKADFNNFVYNAMYRHQLSPQKSLEFNLSADTNNPSISQLQDIDDITTNGLYITGGNSGLKPYYSHSGNIGFNTFNIARSTSFTIGVNGTLTSDYIGQETFFVTDDGSGNSVPPVSPNGTPLQVGQQYSRPINIHETAWSVGAHASFGKPLAFIKSNFNLRASASYNERPGLVNREPNTAKTQSYSLSANLNSNFSENLTLGLNYSFSPGVTNNTHKSYPKATSIGHSISFNGYWRTWEDFVVRGDLSYSKTRQKQDNISRDYNFENLMANASIGKKIFRNKRGEITLAVNDIFNQNKFTNQNVSTESIVNTKDTGIGRYFSVGFTYRLRDFHKNGQSMSRGSGRDRGPEMMNGGMRGHRSGGFGGGRMGGMRNF